MMNLQNDRQLALGEFPEHISAATRNTKIAYEQDLKVFRLFAVERDGIDPDPKRIDGHLLEAWIDDMSARNLAYGTIRRRLAGVAAWAEEYGGLDPRNTRAARNAIERARHTAKAPTVRPLSVFVDGMRAMIDKLDVDYEQGLYAARYQAATYTRDRLVILMLYTGVMTRTELATLHFDETSDVGGVLTVWVNRASAPPRHDKRKKKETWARADRRREIVFPAAADPRFDVRTAFIRWKNAMKASGVEPAGFVLRGIREGGLMTDAIAPTIIRNIVARAAAAAGLAGERAEDSEQHRPSITPRSLRTGAVSDRARRGDSATMIAEAAGVLSLQDGLAEAMSYGVRQQGRRVSATASIGK